MLLCSNSSRRSPRSRILVTAALLPFQTIDCHHVGGFHSADHENDPHRMPYALSGPWPENGSRWAVEKTMSGQRC